MDKYTKKFQNMVCDGGNNMSHVTGRAAKRKTNKQPNKQQQTEKEVVIRSWGVLKMRKHKIETKIWKNM